MDHFTYHQGTLRCEGLAARELAERFGTPLYVYSRATLEAHYDRLAAAFSALAPLVCFSLKCCPNIHIARLLASRGAGADVVSGGELERAFLAGVAMDRVAFAGVGKSAEEIRAALDGRHSPLAGEPDLPDPTRRGPIAWFNAESPDEIDLIDRVARELGTTARVALRVNPDIDPRAHGSATPDATTTGKGGTKFGVDLADALPIFRRALGMRGVRLEGLHLHLGSPIDTVEPYVAAMRRVLELLDQARAEGIGIGALNLGGGFGADYETDRAPHAADYAAAIVPLLRPRVEQGLRVLLEPGRTIAANAGRGAGTSGPPTPRRRSCAAPHAGIRSAG
ncbi:hypothetical protein J4558_09555 [Leptolyngbya sp. 15MV]|nr:hypothetical protein J4558_09555 [Leptolyngbya sp. 15MV]